MDERRKDDNLVLGIDGGGSKCHAVLYQAGRGAIGSGIAGPANPTYGYERTLLSIGEAASMAAQAAGLGDDALASIVAGIGLAGMNLETQAARMRHWQHPFLRAHLTTDLEVACLGAHAGDDGAVMISGTGSSGYAMIDGKSVIVGASGFPAGDVGGGAWMGLQALRAVFEAIDGIGPPTALVAFAETHFDAHGAAIAEQLPGASNRDFARLAPLVLKAADAGDGVALDIVCRGAAYLSRMGRRLATLDPPRLSMIGGLSPYLIDRLDDDIRRMLAPPLESPAMGAVLYARREEARLAQAPERPLAQHR